MRHEAALKIVAIQKRLSRKLEAQIRAELMAEQKRMWDEEFQGIGYERIAAAAH